MKKLSLCIATFNEEAFIKYPMDSCYDWADEVIIVDGGSEDKTIEIVESYGKKVKVIKTDNPPMFHKNKQKAIEAASGEWILQLDADEAVSEELREEILGIVNGPESSPNGYWISRKNWFLGRFLMKGGVYPDRTLRLYRNGTAHFPCKDVHENVHVDGHVGYLKQDLLHYADPTFERYLHRWNRYTSMDAKLLIESKEEPCSLCYFIGKPLYTFFMMYFRSRGFMDGFPGFVFALFSSIRFWAVYIKWWAGRGK